MDLNIRDEFARVLRAVREGQAAEISWEIEGRHFIRRFCPEERLILLGAGHIAVPLCHLAAMIGFSVTVVDDRPDFACTERFPDAAQVICGSFSSVLEKLKICSSDYICVITRGHKWDKECMRQILGGIFPSYIGMIGSKRRAALLLQLLRDEGFDREKVDSIHTPIGLKIKAETPSEIAVSICAELILHRHTKKEEEEGIVLDRKDTDFGLLQFLTEMRDSAALMMVIGKNGSAPVESGALMAVDEHGRTAGTVGGGSGEADAMAEALRSIQSGKARILEVSMSNDIAMEEGMVCGGSMQIYIVPVPPLSR